MSVTYGRKANLMERQANAEVAFLVVGGSRSGEQIHVLQGERLVGRETDSDMRFIDDGVSRRHAVVVRASDTVTIEDSHSTNGTWVNGMRISSPHELSPGDEVRMGSATLRFEDGRSSTPTQASAMTQPVAKARPRVRIGRVVLFGGVANLVILAAGVAIQFATDWTSIGPWLAAPLTGMVAALIEVARDAMKSEEAASTVPPANADTSTARPTTHTGPPKRRASVLVGVLVAVVLVGSGGALVAVGVATVSGYITGNQSGSNRLQGSFVVVDSSGVLTTVESVEQTRDFTRVDVVVQNGLSNTISLPLFGNATLSDAGGTTLEADPFRSSWSETIAPGQLRRGTIVFTGHLPDVQTTATFSFAGVWEQGFDGPDSLIVPGLIIGQID